MRNLKTVDHFLFVPLSFHTHTYIHAYIHTCYIHTFMHTYIHATYIHTCIHTSYIHTYIQATYKLHTYIHTSPLLTRNHFGAQHHTHTRVENVGEYTTSAGIHELDCKHVHVTSCECRYASTHTSRHVNVDMRARTRHVM